MRSIARLTLALLAGAALSSAAHAKDTVIHAGRVIDGTSKTVRGKTSIIIRDGRVLAVEDGFVSRDGADVIDLSRKTVLPGLIDSHVHLLVDFGNTNPWSGLAMTTQDQVLDGMRNAKATLMAGFTSVRDVGGYTPTILAVKKGILMGKIEGPRMWVSGSPLGPTGGHGDASTGFNPSIRNPEWEAGLVDTPEDAIKKVRRLHREGVDLIKIMPSGGVFSIGDDPQAQLMSDSEIKAVVDTAHALHMKVAAHAHGAKPIVQAANLGVDTIEHGSFASPESYAAMKANGTYLVATLLAGEAVVNYAKTHPETLNPSIVQKGLAVGPTMSANLQRAYKAGVKVAFGSDAGVFAHGTNGREFQLMVQAGMPAIDAILSATSGAAALLGMEADIGSIQQGRYADIVAVDGDPVADITLLQKVSFVMQDGKVVKQAN